MTTNYTGTPLRSIRIADNLWEPFKAECAKAGTDASTQVRALVMDWTAAQFPKRKPRKDPGVAYEQARGRIYREASAARTDGVAAVRDFDTRLQAALLQALPAEDAVAAITAAQEATR